MEYTTTKLDQNFTHEEIMGMIYLGILLAKTNEDK